MDVLMAMVDAEDWAGLEKALYDHWSHVCPQIFMPIAEKPWEVNIDEQLVGKLMLICRSYFFAVHTFCRIILILD